jgi:hypothetical protein
MASQKLPSALPELRLGFVLAIGVSEVEVMPGHLAFEGTKQIRPDASLHPRSVAAHSVFRGQGCK